MFEIYLMKWKDVDWFSLQKEEEESVTTLTSETLQKWIQKAVEDVCLQCFFFRSIYGIFAGFRRGY